MRRLGKLLFVPIPVGAFGHQLADSEQLLSNIKQYMTSCKLRAYGIFLSDPSNDFHANLVKREIKILPKIPFLYLHRLLLRLSPAYSELDNLIQKRGIELYSKLMSGPPSAIAQSITFDEEIEELREKFGHIPKLILLVCRDSGYDQMFGEQMSAERSYRNSEIKVFQKSIELLIQEGYSVVRLGRHNKETSESISGLIEVKDIASSNPDKMEFCVAKHCDFVISTGSGPDTLGMFFRKPIYFINAPTVGFRQSDTIRMWFLKEIFSTDSHFGTIEKLDFEHARPYIFDEQLLRDSVLEGKIVVRSRSEDEIFEKVKHSLDDYRGVGRIPIEFICY